MKIDKEYLERLELKEVENLPRTFKQIIAENILKMSPGETFHVKKNQVTVVYQVRKETGAKIVTRKLDSNWYAVLKME